MCPLEHIDRVDLQHANTLNGPPEGAEVRCRRSDKIKTLSSDGNTAHLRLRQPNHDALFNGDEVFTNRIHRGLGSRTQLQFFQNTAHMVLDRILTDR